MPACYDVDIEVIKVLELIRKIFSLLLIRAFVYVEQWHLNSRINKMF